MVNIKALGMVLAGGQGTRLGYLTQYRAKPAVPFGGHYRIIDFVLSNFLNSGIKQILIAKHYKPHSLERHIEEGWQPRFGQGEFIWTVGAQWTSPENLQQEAYQGTANAVYQNINRIMQLSPRYVAVFGGDHIYKMDIWQMIDFHRDSNSSLTVAAIAVPIGEASSFGIFEVDEHNRAIGFEEKPEHPKEMPTKQGYALASMGNYVFDTPALIEILAADHEKTSAPADAKQYDRSACSRHDFGNDIIPMMIPGGNVFVYDFNANIINGEEETSGSLRYWRDVGDVDAFYAANMDLRDVKPSLNLYNREWPIYAAECLGPGVKTVFGSKGDQRKGEFVDSIGSPGIIVSGGKVIRSVLGPNVRVEDYAIIEDSFVMEGAYIGPGARIKRAIIDKDTVIPGEMHIGYDPEDDAQKKEHTSGERILYVSGGGVVVTPKMWNNPRFNPRFA